VKVGDKLQVAIKGRDREGYYLLTRSKAGRPANWAALEKAFADKITIMGTVTGVVKGGLSVDVGVRAFLPASRSGVRELPESLVQPHNRWTGNREALPPRHRKRVQSPS
jgi:small subunit ribosomal protein S1